jgi:hypothetical protein
MTIDKLSDTLHHALNVKSSQIPHICRDLWVSIVD